MAKKLVVAVFEKDSLNRFIYQRMLHLQSETVTSYIFENPKEGLDLARTVKFDLAFIDLHFHDELFSGLEIARQLRSVSEGTRLVAMTILAQDNDREKAKSEGFIALLEKPVSFHDLHQLLKEIDQVKDS